MDLHANRFPPEGRAQRLTPEVVKAWTDCVQRAARLVEPRDMTFHDSGWAKALAAVGQPAPQARPPGSDSWKAAQDLMQLAEDIAQPGWPEPRRDLIDFALTFLEADVVLFRSGYAKRHLIRRLQQSPLLSGDISRLDAMLRRAVQARAGLEEFRAWCRLAGHLVAQGHLAELPAWLEGLASGAILTLSMADGEVLRAMRTAPLTDEDRRRLLVSQQRGRSLWGLAWPGMDRLVEAGPVLDSPRQRLARDAWRMQAAIRRRARS